MTLSAGTRLGPYEILSPIGAGGMGEVYRARDTRLGRDVAVKVLSSHLSDLSDLKVRFEREARAVAALSHPHICAIHDVGSQDGVEYLVMELLDGQSLADRLDKGALPLSQLLPIGIQIAGALDGAHRHGIVHRDLKPGNIMLTKSGVKLLDFGLAKIAEAERAPSDVSSLSTELSPSRPLTEKGTVMGTFQYMAPEQLEGKQADTRTDIFALGCVLYEMATGKKAFTGANQASLVTAIMSKDPEPISSIQPMTPPALDRVVKSCLAKDPEERWQNARDVASELKWIAEAGSQAGAPVVVTSRRQTRERAAWAVAAAALLAMIVLAVELLRRPAAPERALRTSIELPADLTVSGPDSSLALSPDGRVLALTASNPDGKQQIYLRGLDSLATVAVAGTESASYPFWSPDGKSLAFFAGGSLKRVEISRGAVQTVCSASQGRGGTWGPDGTVVFAPSLYGSLYRVPASGGTPSPAEPEISTGVVSHRNPHFLPGGKAVLFYCSGTTIRAGSDGIYALDLPTRKTRQVLPDLSEAYFVPPGYIAFVRQRNVMVQPFDPKSLRLSGEAVPIAEKVQYNPNRGTAEFSFAGSDLFLYHQETPPRTSQLAWYDLDGSKISLVGEPAPIAELAIAPDGKRAAVGVEGSGGQQIWILDLVRGVRTRFTFNVGDARNPVWSPDGRQVAYAANVAGKQTVQVKDVDGGAPPRTIASGGDRFYGLVSWSPDGRDIAFHAQSAETKSFDIGVIPAAGGLSRLILASPANENIPVFSPDGKWLAYVSDESGKREVYVTPYPGPGGKWQVSSGGTVGFSWNGLGEIFSFAPDRRIFAVPVKAQGTGLEIGAARALFGGRAMPGHGGDYSPALKRFLALSPAGEEKDAPITLETNWAQALTAK